MRSCIIKVLKLLEESQFKGSYAKKTKLFFIRGRLSEAITKCGLDVQKTLNLLQVGPCSDDLEPGLTLRKSA